MKTQHLACFSILKPQALNPRAHSSGSELVVAREVGVPKPQTVKGSRVSKSKAPSHVGRNSEFGVGALGLRAVLMSVTAFTSVVD